jgi:hypothetical protein
MLGRSVCRTMIASGMRAVALLSLGVAVALGGVASGATTSAAAAQPPVCKDGSTSARAGRGACRGARRNRPVEDGSGHREQG